MHRYIALWQCGDAITVFIIKSLAGFFRRKRGKYAKIIGFSFGFQFFVLPEFHGGRA